jgi:ribosomal protein L11 methyltransferase
LIRLAVRCHPDQAELVLAELAVLAPGGVEELQVSGDDGRELVEYAIYGGPGELPELGDLDAALGDGRVEVSTSEVADDWADRWREFHRPVLVGGRIWVRPPWADPYPGPEQAIDLVIDPGQAFGTGAHPTTRLCLEAVLARAGEAEGGSPGAFADLGTGSGVLAIAAAKLGFYPVWAYDHDPAAVAAARQNAADNGVEINVARLDLRVGLPPFAPLTTANLVAPMLTDLATRLVDDNLPGEFVCSGILPDQLDAVAAAFSARGLGERGRATDTGWSSLTVGPGR